MGKSASPAAVGLRLVVLLPCPCTSTPPSSIFDFSAAGDRGDDVEVAHHILKKRRGKARTQPAEWIRREMSGAIDG
jgi:hypothetical protein